MEIEKTKLTDCYKITPLLFQDHRGTFVKTFHLDHFKKENLTTNFKEHYYSISSKGVLRGLHFQYPTKQHVKLVYCIKGSVLDVVVDLRIGSPSYGEFDVFHLNDQKKNMIYIPEGMAHGFYVMSEEAVVGCNLSTTYSPEYDGGINWNSIKIPWPDNNPILSDKDLALPAFKDFKSPFYFKDNPL